MGLYSSPLLQVTQETTPTTTIKLQLPRRTAGKLGCPGQVLIIKMCQSPVPEKAAESLIDPKLVALLSCENHLSDSSSSDGGPNYALS